MHERDYRLRNEIFLIVAIKLLLIAILWAMFFRGTEVPVDEFNIASHFANNKPQPKQRELPLIELSEKQQAQLQQGEQNAR